MSENTMGQNQSEEKKGGRGKIVAFVSMATIVVLIVVIVILSRTIKDLKNANETQAAEETKKREVLVTEENAERIAEELLTKDSEEESKIPSHYTVTMNSKWHFSSSDVESDNAYVANNQANSTDVYFDVIRNDTQEVVYSSPVLPVGGETRSIKLNSHIDAGIYECTLVYYLIDENQKVLTTVSMWVELTIDS